ncbi:MFS general substrate transporter, partial [Ramicandelaber brevisporus]
QSSFLRRITWRILPLLFLAYMCSYIDKQNIGNSRVYDLEKDLNMTSDQFGWVVSSFHIGLIIFMLPTTLLFRRTMRPSIWLASYILTWGVFATCMSFAQSFGALLALRLLLGCAESAYMPSMMFYLTKWYKRKELARVFAVFYSAHPIGGVINGFVAYGVGFIGKGTDGKGWSPWRWLFLVEGLPSIILGIVFMLLLPNYPANAKGITSSERQFAIQRIEDDLKQQQQQQHQSASNEEGDLFTSSFNIGLAICYFCHGTVTTSIRAFMPTIIRSMGFSRLDTQLLTIPSSMLSFVLIYVMAFLSDRYGKRARFVILASSLSFVAVLVLAILGDGPRWVRYAFLILPDPLSSYAQPILMAWGVAVNTSVVVNKCKGIEQVRRLMVRIAGLSSFMSIMHNLGSVVAGQMYRASEAPSY